MFNAKWNVIHEKGI